MKIIKIKIMKTIKMKICANMVPKLKSCQTYLKLCTLVYLKVLNMSPENIKKLQVFNRKRAFSHNYSGKRLHFRCLGSEYTDECGCKILC